MRFSFKDAKHLISLLVLFVLALGLFAAIRKAVVPAGFGVYGHYRAGAIDANREHAVSFAGQAECVGCHDKEADQRNSGRHAKISCEACHGPQAKHAADFEKTKPVMPKVNPLCLNCHAKDAAKPAFLPQVVDAEHSNGMQCNDCHQPHQPKM